MDAKERAKIKRTIKSELDDVRREIEDLQQSSGPVSPDNAVGRLSRMDAIANADVSSRLLEGALAKQDQLKKALATIDDDTFGTCSVCGEAIGVQRILALPETTRCIKCADM